MKNNLIYSAVLVLLTISINDINAQWKYDTVSFEVPTSKIIIDSLGNHQWQIGTPGKQFFDSAFSGTKAIITDSINNYLPNDTSSFIYVIRNPYTQSCGTSMEFWHKYDMDTLTEKGVIEASYNGGKSWLIVSDTNGPYWEYYFQWEFDYHQASDVFIKHPLVTSGRSDGWIKSSFHWQWWVPVKADTIIFNPDSLMIRFTFFSDSIKTNKEGWIIDEIVTIPEKPWLCSDIRENSTNILISIFPNPFNAFTTAEYTLSNPSKVTLSIFNSVGELVYRVLEHQQVGKQKMKWSAEGLPPGLYYYRLETGSKQAKGKMIKTKN